MKINLLKTIYTVILIFCFLLPLNAQQLLSLKDLKLKGADVERLQKVLLYYGFDLDKWGADGVFGQATEKALKEYQKSIGKEPTGIISVAELPEELFWKPKITGPVKEKAIPKKTAKDSTIIAGKKTTSRYGSWNIPSENNMGERYYDFQLSPSERFITAFFYSPNGDQPFGIPFYCIDLLTDKKELYYGFQIAGRNSDKDQTLITEGKLSIIIKEIYWTADERLFIKIETVEAGKKREDGYYLIVK
jgi:peptidoglycan hydrolase-like protein with peptidoglycan-binding domain